jgi:hypothetical protein
MRCELRLVAAGTTAGIGLALCIATAGWAAGPRESVAYSTFETELHAHRIKTATVSSNEIEATLDNGQVNRHHPRSAGNRGRTPAIWG